MTNPSSDVLERLRERLGGIEIEQFGGDNFAVFLCGTFERADDEGEEDDGGWKPSAIAGYNALLDAIHAHYAPTIERLSAELPPRIPTPAMMAAAWDIIGREKKAAGIAKLGPGLGVREIWQAMFDAALTTVENNGK